MANAVTRRCSGRHYRATRGAYHTDLLLGAAVLHGDEAIRVVLPEPLRVRPLRELQAAPDDADRREGRVAVGLRATCIFSEPFAVVVTLAMVTVMLMVNVSCDDTA